MLKQAYELLEAEFAKCMEQIKDDAFLKIYAKEKHRHSLQVAGAGNYLLRHVRYYQNKSAEFIEMVKTAILLHDIARFYEIALLKQNKHIDHGVIGAQMLQNMPLFNDIRIWLPIRHHGHLIEELYADTEYQKISDMQLQKEVEHICFIIRDADKIANLHMLVNEPDIRLLFLGKEKIDLDIDGKISEMVKSAAFANGTIPRHLITTVADRALSLLSWYKDINYQGAIDFCDVLHITAKMMQFMADYCRDEGFVQQYKTHLENYLQTHKFIV
ncbi:MAG: HD domain-containing protein [Alphaproteobacteria bacterium]|nr:HD domain-containing protein [Alphaproteobacteria bacterium]